MNVYRFEKNKVWNSFLGKIKNQIIFYRWITLSSILIALLSIMLSIYFVMRNKTILVKEKKEETLSEEISNLDKYRLEKRHFSLFQIHKNFDLKSYQERRY